MAVRPEEVAEDVRVFLKHRFQPRLLVQLGWLDDGGGCREIIAGPVSESVRGPFLAFVEPLHPVAGAANLRAARWVEVGRLHDGQRLGVERRLAFGLGQLGQALLPIDVSCARAVARLARDAEVGHARLKPPFLPVRSRLRAGGVAANAGHVPVLLANHRVRVADEQAVARCPALLVDEPREREANLQVAHHAG